MKRWWVVAGGVVVGTGYALLPGAVAGMMGRAGTREHAVGFAALTGAGMWAAGWRRGWMVAGTAMGLGFAIEVVQRWIPGRGFEWADLWADAAGVGAGWAISTVAGKFFERGR